MPPKLRILKMFVFSLPIICFGMIAFSCNEEVGMQNVAQVKTHSEKTENLVTSKDEDEKKLQILAKLNKIFPIKVNKAIMLAQKKLNLKNNESKSLIPCDAGLSWRVIYLKEMKDVWIAKDNGEIYSEPIVLEKNVFEPISEVTKAISQQDAIEIAKKHFIKYGKETFNSDETILYGNFPSVCDLGDYWRIYFISEDLDTIEKPNDIAKLSNSHPPDYLIDKQTGEIIFCNYFKAQ